MGFTMPAGQDYSLLYVTLRLETFGAGVAPVVELWTDAGGLPGAPIETLANPTFAPAGIANYDFASSGTTLTAGASYWVVAYGVAGADRYDWKASSPPQTPTGLATHLGTLYDANGPPPTGASSILCSYSVTAGISGCEMQSDFNGTADGWMAHSGIWYIGAEYLYTEGLADTWSSASYFEDFADFAYEARMWRSGCDTCANSLVFRGTPDPLTAGNNWFNEYKLQYSRDGNYSAWVRVGGGSAVALVPWTFSPAINQGDAWNTLRVVASGTNLTFYINGTLLWSGYDSSLSSGRVGVGMYRDAASTGDELRVDWARLCTLIFSDGFESGDASAWSAVVP
jgi:hypothetical protein